MGRSVTKVDYATTFARSCWWPSFYGSMLLRVVLPEEDSLLHGNSPSNRQGDYYSLPFILRSFFVPSPLDARLFNHVSNTIYISHMERVYLFIFFTFPTCSSPFPRLYLSWIPRGHVVFLFFFSSFFFVIPSGFLVSPRVFYYRHGKDLGKVQGLGD